MHHLHPAGKGQGPLRVAAAQAAALQGQHGPAPLSPRHQAVLHGLLEVRVPVVLPEYGPQGLLDPLLVAGQPALKFQAHITVLLQRAPPGAVRPPLR